MITTKPKTRMPVIGIAFEPEFMSIDDGYQRLAGELEYYRPRGFSKLARELRRYAAAMRRGDDEDTGQMAYEASVEACDMLTEWARRKVGHDYIVYDWRDNMVGFSWSVEAAIEEADWTLQCDGWQTHGEEPPRGASGLLVEINDHGNVTVTRLSRGKRRELFAVV